MAININRKKAMFFSFISVLIVSFFMMVFANIYSASVFEAEANVIDVQIDSGNNFVTFLEEVYIPKIFRVTSKIATIAILNYTSQNDIFIADNFADLEIEYNNLIFDGVLKSTPIPAMSQFNLTNWFRTIENDAKDDMHIDVKFFENQAHVVPWQSTPFHLGFNLTIPFQVNTTNAQWNLNKTYEIEISIEGLHDPLYLAQPGLNYDNIIYDITDECPYLDVLGDCVFNSTSYIREYLIDRHLYVKDVYATSFLQRLINDTENKTLSGCCGIYSYVVPGINAPSNIPANQYSYVDFYFFNKTIFPQDELYVVNDCNPTGLEITDVDGKFKVDKFYYIEDNYTANYCGADKQGDIASCLPYRYLNYAGTC
jgi:hypothetical protein